MTPLPAACSNSSSSSRRQRRPAPAGRLQRRRRCAAGKPTTSCSGSARSGRGPAAARPRDSHQCLACHHCPPPPGLGKPGPAGYGRSLTRPHAGSPARPVRCAWPRSLPRARDPQVRRDRRSPGGPALAQVAEHLGGRGAGGGDAGRDARSRRRRPRTRPGRARGPRRRGSAPPGPGGPTVYWGSAPPHLVTRTSAGRAADPGRRGQVGRGQGRQVGVVALQQPLPPRPGPASSGRRPCPGRRTAGAAI